MNVRAVSTAIKSFLLLSLLQGHIFACLPAYSQTKPAESVQSLAPASGDEQVSPDGRTTNSTVPNPYQDALGTLQATKAAAAVNQSTINAGVQKILTGEYAPNVFDGAQTSLVFQAAEQGQGTVIQTTAQNVLNANMGAVNDTYRGMHQFFKDDVVGNLFQNVGQLTGKWLSEFTSGWVADCAQYLSKFLRTFLLNPNIAVNGLNGSPDDGISSTIRAAADVMYGIAVDLLLLLFILCIWKYWADAAWQGAGSINLMGPVGRLIFTAGILIAWPTLYAFVIQISNEMISAIVFTDAADVLRIDYALGQVVKGGVIAAGAGATDAFIPVFSQITNPAVGQYVGNVFQFATTLIFSILGAVLITEILYVLILKAIQTALLVAQYMFAPIFLVFFAIPDTESYATGYVKAFVETSLWTFVWAGLFKIMTIVLFSNYNPWGKILILIGVLQIMIQVPSFIGRAQIGPASDFLTAGLVFGQAGKALDGFKQMSSSLMSNGVNFFSSSERGGANAASKIQGGSTAEHSNALNRPLLQSLTGNPADAKLNPHRQLSTPLAPSGLAQGPTLKTSSLSTAPGQGPTLKTPTSSSIVPTGHSMSGGTNVMPAASLAGAPKVLPSAMTANRGLNTLVPPIGKKEGLASAPSVGIIRPILPGKKEAGINSLRHLNPANFATLAAVAAAGSESGAAMFDAKTPELPPGKPPHSDDATHAKDRFEWGHSNVHGANQSNQIKIDTNKFMEKLASGKGMSLRLAQARTSVSGNAMAGVQRVNVAAAATDAEFAHTIYSAALANQIATHVPARNAASNAARLAGQQEKTGVAPGGLEKMGSNWLSNTGSNWNKTGIPNERFQHLMFEQAVKGSQSYVSGKPGNAYTNYLQGRYGEWSEEQNHDLHLFNNSASNDSGGDLRMRGNLGTLFGSGMSLAGDTRIAMQNVAIQTMHPTRRKQAVLASLAYAHPSAKALYGDMNPKDFAVAHGELARNLPPEEVEQAMSIYQVSGHNDLNHSMAPRFIASTAALAATTHQPFQKIYVKMVSTAPQVAQQLGYLPADHDIRHVRSYADLAASILPKSGQTLSQSMQVILDKTGSFLNASRYGPNPHDEQVQGLFSHDPYNGTRSNDPIHPFRPY